MREMHSEEKVLTWTEEQKSKFWAQIRKGESWECWEWSGPKSPDGYGLVPPHRRLRAHRVAWILAKGEPIPKGMCICHICDNPACCNPGHLWLGTQEENVKDMVVKSRQRPSRGERNGNAKLTEAQVRRIREMYTQSWSLDKLAAEFHVGPTTVWQIVRGTTWRHVGGPTGARPRELYKGSKNPRAKLSEEIVKEIRKRYAQGTSVRALAREYHLNWGTVDNIVKRLTWKHVK